jgi:hypothetical protein
MSPVNVQRAGQTDCGSAPRQAIGAPLPVVEQVPGVLDESVYLGFAMHVAEQAGTIALYVRNLKRAGAQLLNIISSVVSPFEKNRLSGNGSVRAMPCFAPN